MRRVVALLGLALLSACVGQEPAAVEDEALSQPTAGPVCHIGPDGGPVVADRGIGGTGAPVRVADRGIGGTGISGTGISGTGIVGVVTGFASICVNGLEIQYDQAAAVDIDGTPGSTAALRVGQVVVIQASDSVTSPVARSISVRREVTGRIDSVELGSGILTIAGQPVSVGDGTWGGGAFRLGDYVAVSGLRRSDGTVVASRLDPATAGIFSSYGRVEKDGMDLRVGALLVTDGAAGVRAGQFVRVTGSYAAQHLRAETVTADPLYADPAAFFRSSVQHLVVQAFVRVADGIVWLNGMGVTAAPAIVRNAGQDTLAIVSLERKADGSYAATALRPGAYQGMPEAPRVSPGAAPGGSAGLLPRTRRVGAGAPVGGQSDDSVSAGSDNAAAMPSIVPLSVIPPSEAATTKAPAAVQPAEPVVPGGLSAPSQPSAPPAAPSAPSSVELPQPESGQTNILTSSSGRSIGPAAVSVAWPKAGVAASDHASGAGLTSAPTISLVTSVVTTPSVSRPLASHTGTIAASLDRIGKGTAIPTVRTGGH